MDQPTVLDSSDQKAAGGDRLNCCHSEGGRRMKSLLGKLFPMGPRGPRGSQGKPGPSAYDIAVQYGFRGTPQEWLRSLKGEQGPTGAQGMNGRDGAFQHEFVRHESRGSDDDM